MNYLYPKGKYLQKTRNAVKKRRQTQELLLLMTQCTQVAQLKLNLINNKTMNKATFFINSQIEIFLKILTLK